MSFKIVISGDICLNSLHWVTEPQNDKGLHWQTHENLHKVILPGEALLLANMVKLAVNASIASPQMPDLTNVSEKDFLNSFAELAPHPLSDKKSRETIYRIKKFLGFSGPASARIKLLPIENDDPSPDMIILDDENNGFHSQPEFWPIAVKQSKKSPLILYKLNNPTDSTLLWKEIEKNHHANTIIIINSEDLRAKGVNISKSLSWEKTAQDFIWQIQNSPNLDFLAKCSHLIVPFGLEGAIYYRNDGIAESRLYFLPYEFEGGSIKENQGKMYGFTSCFVAGIARSILEGSQNSEDLPSAISEGIREGIVAAQKYFMTGFGKDPEHDLFPNPKIFTPQDSDFINATHIQDVVIRVSNNAECQSCWYILKDKSSTNLAEIAYSIVKEGIQPALKFIPIAQFGKLQTVDRTEIESYRSIKNLMWEYISTSNVPRPLCIAVFGTPGSGKSFGVTEIAASIAPKLIQKLNFNLSQFHTPQELCAAFHKVRDLTLEGKLPLIFFDEFDSAFEGKLGWLKYFLAPMQDGVFREGDSLHSIGKAILVFAGGTCSTFSDFAGENIPEDEQKDFLREFKTAKGPDFLSRLRGYVNILGPNQTDAYRDQLFIIRRAMLLRTLLEQKVPHLINDKGEAQLDNGVLRALLKIPKYKHESRSMEAILEMSLLANAKKWEQSHLPSKEQLKLHVDEEQFLRHLMHDTFFSEKVEMLARAIHEKCRNLNVYTQSVAPNFINPWDELSEDLKESTRIIVKQIPNTLLKINYDVVSVEETPEPIQFSAKELDILASYEHTYWYLYKRELGWKRGTTFDIQQKTHPNLVRWASLPQAQKSMVYEMISVWPELLAQANFKIERLKFLCNCEANAELYPNHKTLT